MRLQIEEPIWCVECLRSPRPDENADDDWRAVSDGHWLHVYCPACFGYAYGDEHRPSSS